VDGPFRVSIVLRGYWVIRLGAQIDWLGLFSVTTSKHGKV